MASVGIDANPASVLASQVKTNWTLSPDHVEELCRQVLAKVSPISEAFLLSDTPLFGPRSDLAALRAALLKQSPEGQYLVRSGMIHRHWIDEIPFYISIALLSEIKRLEADPEYLCLLKLALAASIVETVANVRFGPSPPLYAFAISTRLC